MLSRRLGPVGLRSCSLAPRSSWAVFRALRCFPGNVLNLASLSSIPQRTIFFRPHSDGPRRFFSSRRDEQKDSDQCNDKNSGKTEPSDHESQPSELNHQHQDKNVDEHGQQGNEKNVVEENDQKNEKQDTHTQASSSRPANESTDQQKAKDGVQEKPFQAAERVLEELGSRFLHALGIDMKKLDVVQGLGILLRGLDMSNFDGGNTDESGELPHEGSPMPPSRTSELLPGQKLVQVLAVPARKIVEWLPGVSSGLPNSSSSTPSDPPQIELAFFLQRSPRASSLRERCPDIGLLAKLSFRGPRSGSHILPQQAQVYLTTTRLHLDKLVSEAAPMSSWGVVSVLEEEPYESNDPAIRKLTTELISRMHELPSFCRKAIGDIELIWSLDELSPSYLADLCAFLLMQNPPAVHNPVFSSNFQSIIEELDVHERLVKVHRLVDLASTMHGIHMHIDQDLSDKISGESESYLRSMMERIKHELGARSDDKQILVQKYRQRMADKVLPEASQRIVAEELQKLQTIETHSVEFNMARAYLDWLTCLPWDSPNACSTDNLDISHARQVLDQDHYGLDDIKTRILEFIASSSLRGSVQGRVVCLVGPPGTGKTSIARSIATSLHRKFFAFSVGGLSDVAEIKGHRRTYVGAMPGKLVQCLKNVQCANPEIDKVGIGSSHSLFSGDPSAALLEALDPDQNHSFLDHFLDTPYDLSKVLFITTANKTESISKPLLDRMEIIRFSGYVPEEKVQIALRHIIPRTQEETGLKEERIIFYRDALERIVSGYTKEVGVRGLKKLIEKVLRRIGYLMIKNEKYIKRRTWEINADNLSEFLGHAKYLSTKFYSSTPPGVCMGLAWTELGGSIMFVEASACKPVPGVRKLKLTGLMGDVMKESADIAYTFAKNFLREIDGNSRFFADNSIHMHVPEGAIPKDGPSAGCTMATAFISAALGRPVVPRIAMTGELSLTGKILPVGGIKEKTIAARTAEVKRLFLPKDNQKDWQELPSHLRKDIEPMFVSEYSQVFHLVFPQA